jgi:hypothetical protein
MRYILLIALSLLALTAAACSYSTDFVVVNESERPIEVRYKIKGFPVGPPTFTASPAKKDASQLGSRDRNIWKKLEPDEYRIDAGNRTVTVVVSPREALWVTSMHHISATKTLSTWPIGLSRRSVSRVGMEG